MDETKKWCIEQAVASGAKPEEVLEVAEGLYEFINKDKEDQTSLKDARSLTKPQEKLLFTMHTMSEANKSVNGSSIGEELGFSQSYASAILRKLIEMGWVERSGNNFSIAESALETVKTFKDRFLA